VLRKVRTHLAGVVDLMASSTNTAFLSYAKEDKPFAERIYRDLRAYGVEVWWDERSILPGADWDREIRKAISTSTWFIALLSSRAVSKRGVVQREIKRALEVLDDLPEERNFLIPVRLEDCQPSHEKLGERQWVDMFPSWERGLATLLRGLGVETQAIAEVNGRFRNAISIIEHSYLGYLQGVSSAASELIHMISSKPSAEIDASVIKRASHLIADELFGLHLLRDNGRFLRVSKVKYEFEAVPLAQLIDKVVRSLLPSASLRDLQLQTQFEATGEIMIEASPWSVALAVRNIVHNAVKFASAGTSVSIRVAYVGGKARIEVVDVGQIFSKTIRDLVLGGSRLSDADLASWFLDARGLGLEVSRQIGEGHGGSLEIGSKALDEGQDIKPIYLVTVSLALPVRQLTAAQPSW
jgi:signal transduction histidine kinase